MKIFHYLSVYKKFVSTSIQEQASFRTSFILLIFMDLFFYFTTLGSVDFIFNHVDTIGPWNRSQLMLFVSYMLIIDGLHMMFFSHNFWQLSLHIRTGQLDYMLLKPISSIFNCFFREFRSSALIPLPVAIYCYIYFGHQLNFNLVDWAMTPLFITLSLTLLVLMEFILSCSMFWVIEGTGINFLRMQLQQLSRWPNFIYQFYFQKMFTFMIPLLLIGSAPLYFLLDKNQYHLLILMIIMIIIFYQILKFTWNKALNKYESASS